LFLVDALGQRVHGILLVHQVQTQGLQVREEFAVLATVSRQKLVVLVQQLIVQVVDLVILGGHLTQRSTKYRGIAHQLLYPFGILGIPGFDLIQGRLGVTSTHIRTVHLGLHGPSPVLGLLELPSRNTTCKNNKDYDRYMQR
jgi:hypothetical protein